jgi:hypothetical protein
MHTAQRSWQAMLTLFVILGLVLAGFPAPIGAQAPAEAAPSDESIPVHLADSSTVLDAKVTYRVQVTLRNPLDLERLQKLGVTILEQHEGGATVLASEEQLEALARLQFQPRHADQVAMLLDAARLNSRLALSEGTLATLQGVDTDGDGLTDTEEGWWCTDRYSPDSDGDSVSDGQEVSQLLAGNRTNGKPFLGWPPTLGACHDDDWDSVPDLAEGYVIGLSVNRESSDLDKYDDGQEFFGATYCPGGAGSCGYGALPRTVDLYLGSNMPNFVRAPGNSPWVAAFPDPMVTMVDGSLSVESVTTITTDHTIGEGESHGYATSTTKGTSTSNVDLETWNDWQEVEDESGQALRVYLNPQFNLSPMAPQGLTSYLKIGGGTLALVGGAAFVGCAIITGGACLVAAAVATAGGAILGGVSAYEGAKELGAFDSESTTPDMKQPAFHAGRCSTAGPGTYTCIPDDVVDQQEQDMVDLASLFSENQDRPFSESGTQYTQNEEGNLEAKEIHDGQVPMEQTDLDRLGPVTHAAESGGIKGTITTEYSETTLTSSQEFSSSESWSDATAVDTAHAADLRFTYRIQNDGTDIVRELDGLLFNVYLGSDPNPIFTYNAVAQTGTLHNVQPGTALTFASNPIPLTLQQMAEIDGGSTIFVTVEYLSYGGDQLFFEDAVTGGLIVGIEDGWADGDDKFDPYILPCFSNPCGSDPNETLQVILQRGFPTTEDPDGNLLSISTPEVNGSQVTWVEHPLTYHSWWNLYYGEGINYSGALSTTMPIAGGAVVLRFLDDTDLDGFNDRTEDKLGTDPDDPASHPQPELLAGAVSERTGDEVVVRVAFLNTGPYDAAGVEVVAYAPDNTVTLADNVIGGGGRVGSGSRVMLGGRISAPALGSGWSGSARPASSGQYTGDADKTYTFTAAASGSVGSGNLLFNWTDGTNNGQLQFGSGYLSPLPLPVGADGVQVGFNTGTVTAGNSFTVRARRAGDTISYAIEEEPYTPPVLVVSYNDPQGNHRFVTPVSLSSVTDDLAPYRGQMLEGIGLHVTTDAAFDPGSANTTYYITTNPDEQPIVDSHLFVEYIDGAGSVVAEQVFTETLQPGPSVWPVIWDTSIFTETFTSPQDYKVLAFWTDGQGDIIDSSVRPLATFGVDPLPQVASTTTAWDFGVVERGSVIEHQFTVANEGQSPLSVWVDRGFPAQVRREAHLDQIAPADLLTYDLEIDTSGLPTGPLSQTVEVRTGDPHHPSLSLAVTGEILAPTAAVMNYSVPWRPWSQRVFVEGAHSQGEAIEFAHSLATTPDQFKPVALLDFPDPVHLGDGDAFSDLGESSVARLPNEPNAIRLLSPYTFTVGHSFEVPFAFEVNLPVGGSQQLSVTIPYTEYQEVTLIGQSEGISNYDDFEDPRWVVDIEEGNADAEVKTVVDPQDNYLQVHSWAQGKDGQRAWGHVTTAADFRNSSVTTFEFREDIQCSVSNPSHGTCGALIQIASSSASVPLYSISLNQSESYTGTIVFHHDSQTADFYRNGSLVSSGIDLSALDAYRVNFFTSAQVDSSSYNCTVDSTHSIYWTRAYGADPILSTRAGNATAWEPAVLESEPFVLESPNLAAGFNAFISGVEPDPSGLVAVPMTISKAAAGDFYLRNLVLTPALPVSSDVGLAASDLTILPSIPTEGETTTISATLHNGGSQPTTPFVVAFLHGSPPAGTLLGGVFVDSLSSGGERTVSMPWDTTTYTGTQTITVIADPYGRLAETDEDNNQASIDLAVLTKPDLRIPALVPDESEVVEGQSVTITATLRNSGQTDAPASTLVLYEGTALTGTLAYSTAVAVNAGAEASATLFWTATVTGPRLLTGRADLEDIVHESHEGNNQAQAAVYVGWVIPPYIDAGGSPDPDYTPALGYGLITPGTAASSACGTAAEQTLRRSPVGGPLEYRFDHLLPSHFYYLDVTLYECDGAGRQESVYVDGGLVAGPVGLGDGQAHIVSARLDPADYADHTVVVSIDAPGLNGAVVSEIRLYDIDYRYVDAGGEGDAEYSARRGYGWLDGEPLTAWGSLPGQTARIDQTDNELRYRFDRLAPGGYYRLHLTFYQLSGVDAVEKVAVDGTDASYSVELEEGQAYSKTVWIPPAAYQDDGSAVVGIVRMDCAPSGAFLNEITLEEVTQPAGPACDQVLPTPYRTLAYGGVTIGGQPAPAGTVVQALNPRGDLVGCFELGQAGDYGFMQIYGEDAQIPGMRVGEMVEFRVNGSPVVPNPPLYWQDDQAAHAVDLTGGSIEAQCGWLRPYWNLISFQPEPAVPAVERVLSSIEGSFCRVLGETGVYDCELDPVYRTLQELHPGSGYYLRLDNPAGANLRIEGMPTAVTTPIPLHEYWNWVGYLPTTTLPITVALQSIAGHYLMVHSLDKTYNPSDPIHSTLWQMEPGQGYLIRAIDAVDLVYPTGTGAGMPTAAQEDTSGCGAVSPTPYFTLVYGAVAVNGMPASPGARVEILTPRGEVAGCFVVQHTGQYGYVHVYGEDQGDPPLPGFRDGEPLAFRVNGMPVAPSVTIPWDGDLESHQVDLNLAVYPIYLPLIAR